MFDVCQFRSVCRKRPSQNTANCRIYRNYSTVRYQIEVGRFLNPGTLCQLPTPN